MIVLYVALEFNDLANISPCSNFEVTLTLLNFERQQLQANNEEKIGFKFLTQQKN